MTLADLSIRKHVFAWMLMAAMILFGAIGYARLGVSQNPDVDFPVLNIAVTLEGASPEVVETGQHVENKDPIATIIDTRRLRLRFKVSEPQSVRLRNGMTVSFFTSAWPGRTFEAALYHVSSGADPATRMVEVLGRVADPEGILKPGFFAEVKASVQTRRDALLVPERAVLATEQGFVVYEVRDGLAHRRIVTLGLRTPDGEVEILNGLDPGVTVATDGASLLIDGAPVAIAPSGPAS